MGKSERSFRCTGPLAKQKKGRLVKRQMAQSGVGMNFLKAGNLNIDLALLRFIFRIENAKRVLVTIPSSEVHLLGNGGDWLLFGSSNS